jgi:uncharacterized membrane protein
LKQHGTRLIAAGLCKGISAIWFGLVGVPCLLLGLAGLSGRLSDTSERENVQQGMVFIAIGLATLLPLILSFLVSSKTDSTR